MVVRLAEQGLAIERCEGVARYEGGMTFVLQCRA